MGNLASLNAATQMGPGTSNKLAMSTARHTMIVTITGTPTSVVTVLQGSHDGTHWVDVGRIQSTSDGILNTDANGTLVSWIRADLRELVSFGPATVTASIASADGT